MYKLSAVLFPLKPQPIHSFGTNRLPGPEKNPFSARRSCARGRSKGLKCWRESGWRPALLADRGWRFGRMDGSQTFYLSFAVPSDTVLAPLIGQPPGRSVSRGAQWLATAAPLCLSLTSRGQSVVSQARMNCAWKMFAKCNFSFISSNYISEQMPRCFTHPSASDASDWEKFVQVEESEGRSQGTSKITADCF